MIYLDNAATTYPKPEAVYQAVDHCMRNTCANPGRGSHPMAIESARLLFATRESLAQLFGIRNPNQIVFTHNATEALNLALLGFVLPGSHVITTSLEHNAVARPLRQLADNGVQVSVAKSQADGWIDPDSIRALIRKNTKLIVVNHASNVLGTIQPLREIGLLAKETEIELLVDASQTAGVVDISVDNMCISMLAFTGHKALYGLQGTGGLWIREGLRLHPLRYGGTGSQSEQDSQPDILPDRYESGTLNTPGIVGLGAGVDFVLGHTPRALLLHEQQLIARLIIGLSEIRGFRYYGTRDSANRVGLLSFNFFDIDSALIAHRLGNEFDIAVRGGLHCAPWSHQAVGTIRQGAIRVSASWFTKENDIDHAVRALQDIVRQY